MALESNRLGIVHPVLFPGPGNTHSVMRGEGRREYVLKTLQWIVDQADFPSVEITRIKSQSIRNEARERLLQAREAGKIQEVVFSAQMVQLINEDRLVPPSDICSLDENERIKAVERLKECVDEALEYPCDKLAFYSGQHPAAGLGLSGPDADSVTGEALSQLRRSIHEICEYIQEKSNPEQPMRPVLEVFDARANLPGTRFFKQALIGPASRAERLAEAIRYEYGHPGFGLMIDTSHLLINGEGPEVLKSLAPYLAHVHIANVVLNRNTPGGDIRYGDAHPAFHVPDSELTPEVLAGYLKALVENAYTDTVAFEIKPVESEIPEDLALSAASVYHACRNRIDVNYALTGNYKFQARKFFSEELWDRLAELRVRNPQIIRERMIHRKQRPTVAPNGTLVILAADHPARMVSGVGDDPVAMGDRFDYLGRCARVLLASSVDGIMGTADVIEDLILIDYLYQEKTGTSFLDERVLIACMNRGGLAGARYEMWDRLTAYRDAKKIKELHMDGAKLLLRLAVPDPYDRYCIQTMEECARGIEACNDLGLPAFLEPLPVAQIDGQYRVIHKADDLIRVIGVAAGLSYSSAHLWLKIPYVEEYHRVAQAFSGPILMLGGEAHGNPVAVIEQFVRGLGEGENVRGAMIGRNVLYPGDDDPAAIAEAVCAVVNSGASAREALEAASATRGIRMDSLTGF